MNDIKVKYFIIREPGDPSVGLPDYSRTITIDETFYTKKELEAFRSKLKKLFDSSFTDNCFVHTDAEYQAELHDNYVDSLEAVEFRKQIRDEESYHSPWNED